MPALEAGPTPCGKRQQKIFEFTDPYLAAFNHV
jgi:hypothetical protein